jgi:short chain dehydrogenase
MEGKTKKVAIVTGGVVSAHASFLRAKPAACGMQANESDQSGIGAALRELLIKNGWFVVGLDVSSSHVEEISEEARDSFMFMQCNVTSYDQLAKAFSATFDKLGRIDAFCCNAGIIDKSSVYIYNYRGQRE